MLKLKYFEGVGTVRTIEAINANVVAVVGSLTSGVTKQIAAVLSAIGIPQISFSATSPDLSNRLLYKYFLRNVPPGILAYYILVYFSY